MAWTRRTLMALTAATLLQLSAVQRAAAAEEEGWKRVLCEAACILGTIGCCAFLPEACEACELGGEACVNACITYVH
jgi:hypothetical protein